MADAYQCDKCKIFGLKMNRQVKITTKTKPAFKMMIGFREVDGRHADLCDDCVKDVLNEAVMIYTKKH